MAERVDVGVSVVVVVEPDIVLEEMKRAGSFSPAPAESCHVVVGGRGTILFGTGLERETEGHRGPLADQRGGGGHVIWSEEVERSCLVLLAPRSPSRQPVEQS